MQEKEFLDIGSGEENSNIYILTYPISFNDN